MPQTAIDDEPPKDVREQKHERDTGCPQCGVKGPAKMLDFTKRIAVFHCNESGCEQEEYAVRGESA